MSLKIGKIRIYLFSVSYVLFSPYLPTNRTVVGSLCVLRWIVCECQLTMHTYMHVCTYPRICGDYTYTHILCVCLCENNSLLII